MLIQQSEPENETLSATVQPEPSGASSSLATSEQQSGVASEQVQASQRVEELLAVLQKEKQNYQRRIRRTVCVAGVFISLYMILRVIHSVWRGLDDESGSRIFVWCFYGMISAWYIASKQQVKAVHELANYDDVRGVGYLVEALEFNEGAERKAVLPALQRLLPRLQSSDAGLLNTQQRTILRRAAHKNWNTDLTIAILKAWEQIGDERDLETVNQLIARPKISRYITDAAQNCLPFLQQRIERQRQSATLLRASDVSSAHPEHLLRPAEAGASTPSEQLLRANLGSSEQR